MVGETSQRTVRAYKLFRTDPRKPGQLFPLYVNTNTAIPIGKWVRAECGPMIDGRVKSKLGLLAYRPGWHASDLPVATHIGGKSPGQNKPDHRPSDQVWAEVELVDDVDWQTEADRRADRNKAGQIIRRTAHITDQVPVGGFYRYKTNPNMTGEWLISGDMKINRILTDEEVDGINANAGVADLPRLTPCRWAA